MLRFHSSSNLSTVISSFEDLKEYSKKYSHHQAKAFSHLQNWALDGNNTAIQDVSNKLAELFSRMAVEMNQERNGSFKDTIEMFKRIREYEFKNGKLQQQIKQAEKQEKKCLNEIQKCPLTKNIRDYEIKHYKAQLERQDAELKYYTISKENDASKLILFKTHLKRLNQSLLRQNEIEKVLLNAMQDLIEQIPDVSNADEDDLSKINYANFDKTNSICNRAQKRVSRLSLNSTSNNKKCNGNEDGTQLDGENESEKECCNEEEAITKSSSSSAAKSATKLKQHTKTFRSRISCPPNFTIDLHGTNKIFPNLGGLDITSDFNDTTLTTISKSNDLDDYEQNSPPTYSETESAMSPKSATRIYYPTHHRVLPSAPTYNELLVNKPPCQLEAEAMMSSTTTTTTKGAGENANNREEEDLCNKLRVQFKLRDEEPSLSSTN